MKARASHQTATNMQLKGVVAIEPEEEKLIQLLAAGEVDEFRRRLKASSIRTRRQMFARVISARR